MTKAVQASTTAPPKKSSVPSIALAEDFIASSRMPKKDPTNLQNYPQIPPTSPNHLEALKGDRKGQWSIRINDQWRVCFRFEKGDAFDVEVVDYH
jgi:Txe/YoeB family toxin of Txe-Axe toxin-antitoxin module